MKLVALRTLVALFMLSLGGLFVHWESLQPGK
jgi:hypothetical protein